MINSKSAKSRSKKSDKLRTFPPYDVREMFTLMGPPPVLDHEDPGRYSLMLSHFSDAIQPVDAIEGMWVRDLTDLNWKVVQLRRIKSSIVTGHAGFALLPILKGLIQPAKDDDEKKKTEARTDLVGAWVGRDPGAKEQVGKMLKTVGLDNDHIYANVYQGNFDAIERIDRLITVAERRRNSVLREVDRRRAASLTMRRMLQVIEQFDAESETADAASETADVESEAVDAESETADG